MARVLLLIALGWSLTAQAASRLAPQDVPEPLQPWIGWAVHDDTTRDCPYLYNEAERQCVWRDPLTLDLNEAGGSWGVTVDSHARAWLALPGDRLGRWPQEVTVGGVAVVVVERDGRPHIELGPGRHTISGQFAWPRLPDTLPVPSEYGIVQARINGVSREQLALGADGQLWLRETAAALTEGERFDVKVYRHLADELPMIVTTELDLDIAGTQRDVSLSGGLIADSTPLRLESPLPARLEADGSLRLQVRPGHWRLRITTRQNHAVSELAPPASPAPWPSEEVWVFDARAALRVVEVSGGKAIDPRQTTLPEDWHNLPTWRLDRGDALGFKVERRGDPQPAPDQLNLSRELWLDFDGGGYTIEDRLHGQITRNWRLSASDALELGRVELDGEPQFITSVDGGARGIEVRRGGLNLIAESRHVGARDQVPAVGWAHDVNSLSATLHLPPGWRLWSAHGVDNVPNTWLKRWTLLDLFLVLIVTAAVARLQSKHLAGVVLVTLALIWHEPDAPRYVWLHLLAALALWRVLPDGRLRRLAAAYRNVTLLVLLAISVDFMIEQVRIGLYPQLEQPHAVVGDDSAASNAPAVPPMAQVEGGTVAAPEALMEAPVAVTEQAFDAASSAVDGGRAMVKSLRAAKNYAAAPAQRYDYDPTANIQTGPGLPGWRWTTVSLSWNGPVAQGQTIDLVLLSPAVNLVLVFARVALLAALIVVFAKASIGLAWTSRWRTLLPMLLGAGLLMPGAARADYPDPKLIDQLRARLNAPPDCLPGCAAIPRMRLAVDTQNLSVQFEAHLAADVALPLPGGRDQWTPRAIVVDGATGATTHRRADGSLWLALSAGTHQLAVHGAVPTGATFQLPLPLTPQRLEVEAQGWSVTGQRRDGGAEPELIFTRLTQATAAATTTLEPRALPAFFTVQRELRLGLDWRVETTIVRTSPPDSAAALAIPLLPGESVTSADVEVKDGRVQVTLAADVTHFAWQSVLSQAPSVTLVAPQTSEWVEIWRADISPVWHANLQGIAVVHHQSGGQWSPTWQPWPGESVTIELRKPDGVVGNTLTIDRSQLRVEPAERATAYSVDFNLRSSQGGQHALTLPAGAVLQSIALNGVPQPIRQEETRLTLPVVPGAQAWSLTWRDERGMATRFATPNWSLGTPSVNASIRIQVPQDRWVLFTHGPRLGPAVLFWGVLIVLVVIALALGRTRYTPLTSVQWVLLAIGLTQVPVVHALFIVGWLFALAWRGRTSPSERRLSFNLVQIALAVATLVALSLLFSAIERGLLGEPDMQIAGNGSGAGQLNWFQDRADSAYPGAGMWSVSIWIYRGLMLAWALWLALALLDWLRWGWRQFTMAGLWRSPPPRAASAEATQGDATAGDDSARSAAPPASA